MSLRLTPIAPAFASAPAPTRIIALDWGIASTMMALGMAPLGVPVPSWYRRIVEEPVLPDTTIDVGLLNSPNFELLQSLSPTRILIGPGLRSIDDLLTRIAPVGEVSIATASRQGIQAVERETMRLATLIGMRTEAERFVAETDRRLAQDRDDLAGFAGSSVLFASIIDARHLSVFGDHCLVGQVVRQLGLVNAGQPYVPDGMESAIIGVERIAGIEAARFAAIATDTNQSETALSDNPLFQALPILHDHRAIPLPPVYRSGGLPAMARLSRLLSASLIRSAAGSDG